MPAQKLRLVQKQLLVYFIVSNETTPPLYEFACVRPDINWIFLDGLLSDNSQYTIHECDFRNIFNFFFFSKFYNFLRDRSELWSSVHVVT